MVKKPHQRTRRLSAGSTAIESVGRSTVTLDLPVFAETTDQSDQQQLAEAGDYASSIGTNAQQGVVVAQVAANSGASRAGLRRGDVIITIDGRKVKDYNDLSLPGHQERWRQG